jgi:ABC-type antimicrobial peptide transport system permease subunit
MVINERAAQALWSGAAPTGRELEIPGLGSGVVVGVVNDVRYRELAVQPVPEVYLPYPQLFMPMPTFVVRTTDDSAATLGTLEDRIERTAGFRSGPAERLPEEIARSVHVPRFRAILFGLMALLVVILASVGVFSVTAHAVAQHRREMGIRIAIGAQPGQVARMTLLRTIFPVMLGVGIGLFGALATTRLVSEFLFETTPTDPAVLGVVLGVVIVTSLIAAWLPARKTLRIDPAQVLRLD